MDPEARAGFLSFLWEGGNRKGIYVFAFKLLCVAGRLSPHTVRRSLSNSSQPADFFPTTLQELPALDCLSAGRGAPGLRRGIWRSRAGRGAAQKEILDFSLGFNNNKDSFC